jgi:hypothetical protein
MSMVLWHGKLVPRALVTPDGGEAPGVCVQCGGLGLVPETLHDDRLDEMCPCWACRKYCGACRKWVRKVGHACVTHR